ncbi:MAG: Cell division protein FtsQ [Chlamydiales bacterium]|nr:Cell division protein FtsQ [Chlamydiales bacterium]MCH9635385.1 Cell division protein FtsQ [Chlamydiales bacterium]
MVAIVQDPDGEKLPTQCLAELLELSVDQPISFAHFPLKEAQKRLEQTALFEQVRVKKVRPNMLYICYSMRKPIAKLGDRSNCAVDANGTLFPIEPYFTKRELPLVFGERLDLLPFLEDLPALMIDLSAADAPTLGKREIVVHLEDGRWLRLGVRNLQSALAHFKKREWGGRILDFRISNTAYIHE